jgi:hypothetical protein
MSQFSLQMGMAPIVISGLLQGFGLGCTQVPLNIIALSTLPPHILTQGTAIRGLMRNLGGSIGISANASIEDRSRCCKPIQTSSAWARRLAVSPSSRVRRKSRYSASLAASTSSEGPASRDRSSHRFIAPCVSSP